MFKVGQAVSGIAHRSTQTDVAMRQPDHVLCDTGLVKIGAFRCGPHEAAFENSGPIENYCFVFPRTAVVIEHDHARPFIANPNVVTFYNRRDEYRRRAIANDGDRSDWFAVRHDVVVEIAQSIDPAVEDRPERPFRFTHALSNPKMYAYQRQLFNLVSQADRPEPLAIDEAVIRLLEKLLRSANAQAGRTEPPQQTRRGLELVHDAQTLLSREFAKGLTLSELAAMLDVSVFHLCRVFQRAIGCTLHEYRHQLRLRWSLEQLVTRPRRPLVQCALDAGFSSHSHFGSAFKRAFGRTPSEFVRVTAGDDAATRSVVDDSRVDSSS
jgi:AraC family transcriptional regulator